jgi:hypothetical protein
MQGRNNVKIRIGENLKIFNDAPAVGSISDCPVSSFNKAVLISNVFLPVCRSVRAIKRARSFKRSPGTHETGTILQLRVTSACKIAEKYIAAGFAEVAATAGRKVRRSVSFLE